MRLESTGWPELSEAEVESLKESIDKADKIARPYIDKLIKEAVATKEKRKRRKRKRRGDNGRTDESHKKNNGRTDESHKKNTGRTGEGALPKHVNICGIRHKVRCVDDKFQQGSAGMIDHKSALILINNQLTQEVAMETLVHEILHGMLLRIGRIDLSDDEVFVSSLANAVYQTFGLKRE